MKYFNRQAQEITEAEWFCHTLDPIYTKVDRHSYGATDVVSYWLGLQTIHDKVPIIWCTFIRKFDGEHGSVKKSFWFTSDITLAQVKAFHKGLVMEVGIPVGVPKR